MTLLLHPQTFLKNADTVYWIGLQKTSFPWYDYGWLEEGEPDSDGITDAWFWVDGSLYDRYPRHGRADTPCPDPFSSNEALGKRLIHTSTQPCAEMQRKSQALGGSS